MAIQKSEQVGNQTTSPTYLRASQGCEYIRVSSATWWRLVASGKLVGIKISPKVMLWRKEDIDAYVLSCAKA